MLPSQLKINYFKTNTIYFSLISNGKGSQVTVIAMGTVLPHFRFLNGQLNEDASGW